MRLPKRALSHQFTGESSNGIQVNRAVQRDYRNSEVAIETMIALISLPAIFGSYQYRSTDLADNNFESLK